MLPSLVDDRMTQLPRAVRPEVEEDHAVAVGDGGSGITVRWHDPGRLEEFVVDSPGIALRNEGDGVGRRRSLGLDDREVDLRQVLEDDPAGADIEMTDLRVPLLARR